MAGVPSCKSLAQSGNTYDCLKLANSTEIRSGLLNALSSTTELYAFDPTLDGPDGLYPDLASLSLSKGNFARLPFIAGTNLDEGQPSVAVNFTFTEHD